MNIKKIEFNVGDKVIALHNNVPKHGTVIAVDGIHLIIIIFRFFF